VISFNKAVSIVLLLMLIGLSSAQLNRISLHNQSLFLSGANLAWLNFARDIGPGDTDFDSFGNIMLDIHDNGGNALRWWLHTDGSVTPQFGLDNLVREPGENAIIDLQQILDLAWEREIGLILCLWSFDMLRLSNSETVLNRNRLLLSDTTYLNAYIANALIPIVDAVKGHPTIIAWEIFNEPEGMSDEFGWSFTTHVPMFNIQRFINRCAAAIHRCDPDAQVTSGAWSLISLSDVNLAQNKTLSVNLNDFSSAEIEYLEKQFEQKYGNYFNFKQIIEHVQAVSTKGTGNYYADYQLIEAGGDVQGTLDFYSVHYYKWAGRIFSPFHHSAGLWNLDKPLVVAEFDMAYTFAVHPEQLFETLHRRGYAGALPWSWTDENFSTPQQMLSAMKMMWDSHREDVDIAGIGGDWPDVRIISPKNGFIFAEDAEVLIEAEANDDDGTITRIEFLLSDGNKIGEDRTEPYNISFTALNPGIYSLFARATDNQGHQRTSEAVTFTLSAPPFGFELRQNYPNPFNPLTVIRYTLAMDGDVTLKIYDIQGQLVATLVDERQESGPYQIEYDAEDLASGTYFVRLKVNGYESVRRIMRMK
jgi:hypothetical protein